jgi:hypothetical protein
LLINSTAQDECRKQLFKHIMFLKQCMREVYGENTDIDFKKIESKIPLVPIEEKPVPQTNQMPASKKPSNLEDIAKTQMVQKAVELLQPETPIRY